MRALGVLLILACLAAVLLAPARRFELLRRKVYRLVYWRIIPAFNPLLLRISYWSRPEPDNELNRFWYGIHELAWGLVCGSSITQCFRLAWIWWRPKSWDKTPPTTPNRPVS